MLLILAGISGVGKTTLVESLVKARPEILALQASSLLKAALLQSGEQLRIATGGAVTSNQAPLASALEAARAGRNERPVILDAHLVIDNDRELIEIPIDTFRALHPTAFLMLKAAPATIAAQRASGSRARPIRSFAELDRHQATSERLALHYSSELRIPCRILDSADLDAVAQFVAEVFKLST